MNVAHLITSLKDCPKLALGNAAVDQEVDTGSKTDDVSEWLGFSSTMANRILQSLDIKSGFC